MANLDTPAKRLSSLDFEEVWEVAAPIPDGAISQADRQHSIWTYAGILIEQPVPVTGIVFLHLPARSTTLHLDTRTGYSIFDGLTLEAGGFLELEGGGYLELEAETQIGTPLHIPVRSTTLEIAERN